jgi:hypothetical protein
VVKLRRSVLSKGDDLGLLRFALPLARFGDKLFHVTLFKRLSAKSYGLCLRIAKLDATDHDHPSRIASPSIPTFITVALCDSRSAHFHSTAAFRAGPLRLRVPLSCPLGLPAPIATALHQSSQLWRTTRLQELHLLQVRTLQPLDRLLVIKVRSSDMVNSLSPSPSHHGARDLRDSEHILY